MRKSYHRPASILTQQLDFSFHLPKKPFNMDITKPVQHPTMCNLAHGAGGQSRQQEGYSHLHHVYNQPQETDTPVPSIGNNPSLYQVFRPVMQRSSNINFARAYRLLPSFGCFSNWYFPSFPM